ncbi:MAG: LON peptidase substrate-binding domain-containing protein [Acetobacteraceae bacterium]|nr:LON peptidase substrate-binding domain-containing protein [Acetobacteraceae bacterium]
MVHADELPIFPLSGALLLPGGKLPLNIFEPRYQAMVETALGAGRVFGMVQPDASQVEGANGPALYQIGCLGRMVSFSETDDGRYLITLQGTKRFRITEELAQRHGFRQVRAVMLPLSPDPDCGDRDALLTALRPFFVRRNMEVNWEHVERMPDPALITTLAMVCPFADAEKQALLEADSLAERAAVLLALLRMDAYSSDAPEAGRAS